MVYSAIDGGFNIANIIIIEDDQKLEREMLQFIKEMGDHQVRTFDSSTAFEDRYLAHILNPPTDHSGDSISLEESPYVAGYTSEQIEWLVKQHLSKAQAFPRNPLTIVANKENLSLMSTDQSDQPGQKLLGQDSVGFTDNNKELNLFIHEDFREHWQAWAEELQQSGRATGMFPFAAPDNGVWLIEVQAAADDSTMTFELKDRTRDMQPLITEKKHNSTNLDEEEALNKLGHFDLIIFKYNCVDDSNVSEWIPKIMAATKNANLWPENNVPRFVATKYEDDGIEKINLVHPLITDLICLPLDRLIFLQKIEIVLALPNKTTPTFLFQQDVEQKIEISKRSMISRVTDLGVALVNPVPLSPGVPAHLYFRFPGQDKLLNVYAKVIESAPHPEMEGKFLVYFAFFGLGREALTEIRKYLQRDTGYKNYKSNDPGEFEYNPDNIFLTEEQKRIKTIAIIDPDPAQVDDLGKSMRKEVSNTKVITETSYYMFIKRFLESDVGSDVEATVPTRNDVFATQINWVVSAKSHNLIMVETQYSEEDLIIDHKAGDLFAEPQSWMKLFGDADAKELLIEAFFTIQNRQRIDKMMNLTALDGSLKIFNVNFSLVDDGANVQISVRVPAADKVIQNVNEKLRYLETLIIDHTLVPDDIDAWVVGLNELLGEKGVITRPGGLPIIIMGSDISPRVHQKLFTSKVNALVQKPVESRRMEWLVSHFSDCPNTINTPTNINWKEDSILAYVAKDAQLTQISEFGCTIKQNRPLARGTPLYLHTFIYEQAPGGNLTAVVYNSEQSESEKGTYDCALIYFGINEAFLKYTRSWIRENYASRKSGG